MANIHPTAIIADGADIHESVAVGPYCVIGQNVAIGANTTLKSHVVIEGRTTLGENNTLFPFVSLGQPPQDKKFKGEDTQLIIGDDNQIREYVTINPGTEHGGGKTVIGSRNLFMALSHVGHDCKVGNDCVLANSATLAGHVEVADFVIIGGLSGVHQFVRVGEHSIIGGGVGVVKDVAPYAAISGERARLEALNITGLKRREFDRETIKELSALYKEVFFDGDNDALSEKVQKAVAKSSEARRLLDFISTPSKRGLCLPKKENINE